HIASAMRSTNKDHAFDPGIRPKCCGAHNQTVTGFLIKNRFGHFAHGFLPHGLIKRNDLVVSEHPTHAVTDHDVRLMIWVSLIHFGEFLAQTKCGIQNWIACRVSKYPELIMLADLWIGLKSIDGLYPGPWCREKPVYKDQRNAIGIVRLEEIKADLCRVMLGFESADQSYKCQISWRLVEADRC